MGQHKRAFTAQHKAARPRRAGQELTKTKHAFEARTRASASELLRLVVEFAPSAFVMIDRAGVIALVNAKTEELFGYARQELIGQVVEVLVPERYRAAHPGYRTRFLAAPNARAMGAGRELLGLRKDGSEVSIEIGLSPLVMKEETFVLASIIDITARKRAQEERDRLFTFSLDMYCIAGFDGYFKQLNPAWTKTLGWSNAELQSKPYLEFVHPDDREATTRAAGRLIDGKLVFYFDNRYLCKDGSYKWISWVAYPLPEEALIFSVARDITERKHAETELASLQRHHKLILDSVGEGLHGLWHDGTIAFENPAAAAMLGWQVDELIGKPAHATMHYAHADGSPYPQGACQIYATLRDGVSRRVEDEVFWRKDGSCFPVAYTSTAMRNAGGDIIGVVVSFRDITERRRADAALLEARTQLEARVAERTSDLAAVNDSLRAEIVQRMNTENLLKGDQEVLRKIAAGRSLAEVLTALAHNVEAELDGVLCSILLMDSDRLHLRHGAGPTLPDGYNRAIDGVAIGPSVGSCGTAAFYRKQVIVTDIATDPLWATFRGLALEHQLRACWSTPILSSDARVLGTFAVYARTPRSPTAKELAAVDRATYLATIAIERAQADAALRRANEDLERKVIDRTAELVLAKERAESADRLKSSFLATMSHELRTPLNSIIGFTGVILQGLAGPLNQEQNKQLEMVRGSARHLLALINDVLDISKIEAGQLGVTNVRFDLVRSIHKVIAVVTPLAQKKQLALRVDLAPELGQISGDERRVEQVLLNLLSNAIKFTDRGEVALRAEIASEPELAGTTTRSRSVRVHVSDTGMGIKPEDRASLFQPFRQIDTGLARNHEGTGLGLAICRRLVELMGGEMSVTSAWGQGSTFTFTLRLEGSGV